MPHGGRRPGAGRPKGAANRMTPEAQEFTARKLTKMLERLVHLAEKAESESVQLGSLKEFLHTALGKPRMAEPPNEAPIRIERTYRCARDESEATFDPARERMKRLKAKAESEKTTTTTQGSARKP